MEKPTAEFFEELLLNNFPEADPPAVKNIVQFVMENETGSEDAKFLMMANLFEYEQNKVAYLDEAVGIDINQEVYQCLESVFPNAHPNYLKKICTTYNHYDLNELIDLIIADNYELRPTTCIAAKWKKLVEIFPDADPDFLKEKAHALETDFDVNNFIVNHLGKEDFPSRKEFIKKKEELVNFSKYSTNFDVDAFLEKFPKPFEHFSDPNRSQPLKSNDIDFENDKKYALNFLYHFFSYLRKKDIDRVFKSCKYDLVLTCDKLESYPRAFLVPKQRVEKLNTTNLALVQEIAYLEHRKDIRALFKLCDENYRRAKDEAIKNNLLQTCKCCFDEELIPEECYFCKKFCIFCKSCVKSGVETGIGDGKLDFPCLADCGSEFSVATLQMILDSVTFAKLAQRKQMDEIKKANIDGLETCPFCEFATIPNPDDKIFRCLNTECMKESCRKCWHLAHVPIRCEEIEYDEDVKMRTYIENKMSEALLRECWRCKKKFVKESGCNKMTCNCGALMCYVCRQPVQDYTHFGDSDGRCPLWTEDIRKFHEREVVKGATSAKIELGVDKEPNKLKVDPAKNLNQFF